MESNVRDRVIMRASWVSTIGNALLSALKITVGLLAGSMAVLGDGVDSAADVVISVVMIVTAHVMNRPPTRKFPYGYQKAEGIATKVLAMVVFYAGVQMLVSTVQAIMSNTPRSMPDVLAVWVTVFSIAGKLFLSLYQYRQGRRVGSTLLVANAVNMRNDVIISAGVLAGLLFTFVFRLPVLDLVTGLIISLFIIRSAVGIFIESNTELMDGVDDVNIYDQIFEAVEAVPQACRPHRVRSRQIGGKYEIVLDIEVDGDLPLSQAHAIAHEVEAGIRQRLQNVYDIIVHVEPTGGSHHDEKFGIEPGTK